MIPPKRRFAPNIFPFKRWQLCLNTWEHARAHVRKGRGPWGISGGMAYLFLADP